MDNSAITHGRDGAVTLTGDAIQMYAAAQLRGFIRLYAKTGIIPTRGVTIRRMLDLATQTTGRKYKNSQPEYARAIDDLDIWIQTMKAALPIIQE